jgi:hypothetical protein
MEAKRQIFCTNGVAASRGSPIYFKLCLKLTVVQNYLQGRKNFYAFIRL